MKSRMMAALALVLTAPGAYAVECKLEHATYIEPLSGVVLAFHPKSGEHGLMTPGVFDLTLPNMSGTLAGEITWGAGRNARPDGFISRDCGAEEKADNPDACWFWMGNVYAIGDGTATLVDDAEMMAPQTMLLADLGRALRWDTDFITANPDGQAMDVFTLSACAPQLPTHQG
ncbi:MAG TPA: hypothetical protein VL017_07525 [Devosia sp.]|nr:hypothetical protein [Devosia sp.]